MAAELIGDLVLVDDCLRVNASNISGSYWVVWPPDVVLNTEHHPIEIRSQSGEVLARVGDKVRLSGGESSNFTLREPLSKSCAGPYWIAGDELGRVQD